MSFAEIRGHGAAKEAFARWIREGRVPHAVLLVGPEGIGKFRLAEAASWRLLCAEGGPEACGRCPSCKKSRAGVHPDLLILEPSGRGGAIGIDTVRGARRSPSRAEAGAPDAGAGPDDETETIPPEPSDPALALGLVGWLSRRPLEGPRKCAVIRDADRLTPEAAGALLKTLEEPPAGTTLLLTAPSTGDLPETVVSRCRVLRLWGLDEEDLVDLLAGREGASPEAARAAARAGAGSVSEAIEALEGDAARMRALFERFLASEVDPLRLREDVLDGLPKTAGAADRRSRAKAFFRSAIVGLRERWRGLVAGEEADPYGGGEGSPLRRLERGLEAAGEALRDADRYVDPGLLVDDFALALAGREERFSPSRRSDTD